MKKKLLISTVAILATATMMFGCKKKEDSATSSEDGIKHFTAFFDVEGSELNQENDIKKIIAEKIGADCQETWLTGQTAEEARGMLIASGEYPDFLNSDKTLIEAGALVPLDEYLDDYPNIKNFWNETQWESLRQPDGHIYSIPQFDNINEKSMATQQSGEAFWIQTRVLKWAGYPVVESLDQLFDVLERYTEANPTMTDGTPVIPFEILTYDWYYFCLENPPQFLDGYPNNGRCIVDPDTYQVVDYNTTNTATRYFKKLNEVYKKGLIDQEFMTMNHDEFAEKVSSGRVLCMVEQHWDFQTAEDSIKAQGLDDCTYVPLGITIDPGMSEMYYASNESLTLSGGLSISVSCKDVQGALKFVNDLLSPEITTLRSWGVEGVDYLVDENGIYYRTQEMRDKVVTAEYKASHLCSYGYFPNYAGMNLDGKNAALPTEQPGEFYDSLSAEVQECLKAYGAETYVEMLDQNVIDPMKEPWYPMWSYVGNLPTDTNAGMAWTMMEECKKEYVPKLVIADDFDAAWETYMEKYKQCNPEDFFAAMQEGVYERIELVTGEDKRPEGYVKPEE